LAQVEFSRLKSLRLVFSNSRRKSLRLIFSMALRLAPCFSVLFLVLQLVVVISASSDATTVIIRDGYLQKADGSKGEYIGLTTSVLQAKVVDTMFEPVNTSSWSNVSLINRTIVRSLDLHGEYQGDTQLMLPSLFRLRLNGSITVKPGLSAKKKP